MAGAEQGDGRLRVGPYLRENKDRTADPASAAEASAGSAASEGDLASDAALQADTQALPTVPTPEPPVEVTRVEQPVRDSTVVRAVAKRAAAALPALGPASAKRQAASVRIPQQVVRDQTMSSPEPEADSAARPGTHDIASDVPVSMSVAPVSPMPGAGTVYGTPPGRHAHLDDPGEEGVGDVTSRAAEPSNQDEGPERGPDRPTTVPSEPAPPRPGSGAFADAMTEQWILPPENERPAPDPERPAPRPWHEVGRAAPRSDPRPTPPSQDIPRSPAYGAPAAESLAEPAGRPGPVALEQDDWGGEPAPTPATEYAGRRRGNSALRTWLGIAAALVILAGAVGLPFLLHASSSTGPSGAAGQNQADNNGDLVAPVPTGVDSSPAGQLGDPASSGPAASATPQVGGSSPIPSSDVHQTAPPTQPVAPPTTTQPPPVFQPVTIRAESGTPSRGASVMPPPMCRGGSSVVGPLGTLSLTVTTDIKVAGMYKVQVFFTNPSFVPQSASLSANGGISRSLNFPALVNCAESIPSVSVALHTGTNNAIVISGNTFSINIDRIVISQA